MINILYYILIISAVLGYSISLPLFLNIYFFHIIFAILLYLFLLYFLLKGKIELGTKKTKKYLLFFLMWFLWLLISFLWSDDKSLAIKFILIYAMMFLFSSFLILYNQNEKILKKTLKVLLFISLIAVFIGSLEAFTSFRLSVSPLFDVLKYNIATAQDIATIPTSFFYNPNNYATFLSFSLPFFLFGITYFSSRQSKIGFFIIASLVFINVIMTNSNFNILASLVILLVYFGLCWTKNKSIENTLRYIGFFFLVLCMFILIINTNDYLNNRFKETMNYIKVVASGQFSLGRDSTLSIRATIANRIFCPPSPLNFFVGVGVGNTRNYLKKQNIPEGISDPHNWWLEISGDFGFFFFLAYISFFISLLKSLWRIMKKSKDRFDLFISHSCFLSLIGFIIASMSPSSVVYFIPHWILIAVSIIVVNLLEKKHENSLSI